MTVHAMKILNFNYERGSTVLTLVSTLLYFMAAFVHISKF